jgi:hypothetical protein
MKRNSIIFLDIDGVLASYLQMKRIDPEGPAFIDYAVEAFNKLVDKTNSDVCISSSWRIGRTIEDLQETLNVRNVKCTVVGKTDRFGDRGEEILKWLKENPQYTEYIIIDDEMSDIEKHIPYYFKTHIKTNMFQCLTIYDIAKCRSDFFRSDAEKHLKNTQKYI